MGIGSARGDNRAVEAAEFAISSPLLEASIDGAHGVLLSIQGGSDLGLFEINEAARMVQEAAHPEANIIFGAVIDDALGDEVRVTVIAAGFDGGVPQTRRDERRAEPAPAAQQAALGPRLRGPPGLRRRTGPPGPQRVRLRPARRPLGARRQRPPHRLDPAVAAPARSAAAAHRAAARRPGRRAPELAAAGPARPAGLRAVSAVSGPRGRRRQRLAHPAGDAQRARRRPRRRAGPGARAGLRPRSVRRRGPHRPTPPSASPPGPATAAPPTPTTSTSPTS